MKNGRSSARNCAPSPAPSKSSRPIQPKRSQIPPPRAAVTSVPAATAHSPAPQALADNAAGPAAPAAPAAVADEAATTVAPRALVLRVAVVQVPAARPAAAMPQTIDAR